MAASRATAEARAIIARAAELIATPDRWTQEVLARDASGQPVSELSEDAVRFCAAGAVVRAEVELFQEGDPFGAAESLRRQIAFALLGRTFAREVLAELGFTFEEIERKGGSRTLLPFLWMPDPPFWISWDQGVLIANDLPEVDHSRILAVFQHTIEDWDECVTALTWLVKARS